MSTEILIIDDNPDKINIFSPGYHIPVYNSKKITIDKPDIIILAWRYNKQILKKLKNIKFKKTGGKFIIPLPEVRIISYENL